MPNIAQLVWAATFASFLERGAAPHVAYEAACGAAEEYRREQQRRDKEIEDNG